MNSLIKLLNSAPGINESDDVVLRLPWEVYESFGEGGYGQIADYLLDPLAHKKCPNLAVVLRELPYCTDGVPESFLKWCIGNCEALLKVNIAFKAASYACLRWDSVWRSDSWRQRITEFANLVSPYLQRVDDTELRQLREYGLKQSQIYGCATDRLRDGSIVVTDTLVSHIVDRDSSLAADQLGLSCLGTSDIKQGLAACLLKTPKSKIGDVLYRSTFEVSSKAQPQRFVVDAEWILLDSCHELQNVFWGSDANNRRRKLWENSK